MASEALTQAEAMDAYRAVCKALSVDVHPVVVRQGMGSWPNGPVLCMDFEGWRTRTEWAVVWEGGPYEWAMWVPLGGQGFSAAEVAKGVFLEPITDWALGLYREWSPRP